MKFLLVRDWLAPVAAGAVLPFCFAPYHYWPLLFPTVWLLMLSVRYEKPAFAALQGWLFGVAFFGVGVSWIHVSIHEHGNAPLPLAIALTALFVAAISLFSTLQFYLTARFTPVRTPLLNSLSFISLWVLFEWLRSWLLTGFPWLFLGNALIESPLAGWAPVTGVYGVTALALLTVTAIPRYWPGKQPWFSLTTLLLTVAVWLGGWWLGSVSWTRQGDAFQVSMVQANIAQKEKWKPENTTPITRDYLSLTESLWDSDLIIWPETALPYFLHQATNLLKQLDEQAKATNTTLAMGILSAEFGPGSAVSIHNSFTVMGEGEGLYHKQKLVPFGEYVPLESILRGLIDFFDLPMSNMTPGSPEQTTLSFRDKKMMPLICYEIVYPDFVASYARQADLLITVSNDSWFGTSIGPHQHLQIARMRALETQRYVLRSTNNGITAIINPQGGIDLQAPQFKRTLLRGEAFFQSGDTPFMITGSWPTITLTTFLIFYCRRKINRDSKIRDQASGSSTSS